MVVGTLYHPAAFGYGMIAGAAVGMFLNNKRIVERLSQPHKIAKELHGLLPQLRPREEKKQIER